MKIYENENILIYEISYQTSTGTRPLRFIFNKIDGFIKVHNILGN